MSEDGDLDFARRLGGRLRAVRVQKGWSLHDVQVAGDGEFSAASVGSYERGDRLISVPRLNRLARLYRVPLEEFLPPEDGRRRRHEPAEPAERVPAPLVIDLTALEQLDSLEWEPIRQFSRMIQTRRGDFNGRVLTIRAEDARGLALVCGHDVDDVERLIGVHQRAMSG
jgi:transcriptional regulator with XRE-family HTH domain